MAPLSGGIDRPMETVVKASYQIQADGNRRVNLKVELVRAKGETEVINKTVRFEEASRWLVTELAASLVKSRPERGNPLALESQIAILTRHAQRFADLGDWERSTMLRETALVRKPHDALQRARWRERCIRRNRGSSGP